VDIPPSTFLITEPALKPLRLYSSQNGNDVRTSSSPANSGWD
jgi:hypothetical protein